MIVRLAVAAYHARPRFMHCCGRPAHGLFCRTFRLARIGACSWEE